MPIPTEVQPSWSFIWQQVVGLNVKWKFHEQLYGSGQPRVDLLMNTASNFFAVIQETLLLGIELEICKLGDPARTRGFDNLTLSKLVEEINNHDPQQDAVKRSAFQRNVVKLHENFLEKSKHIRKRRNKFFTHLDYKTALSLAPEPLFTVTRTEIQDVLSVLKELMSEIEIYFGEPRTTFDRVITTWDGEALISALKRTQRYCELEKDGTLDYQGWKKSPCANA